MVSPQCNFHHVTSDLEPYRDFSLLSRSRWGSFPTLQPGPNSPICYSILLMPSTHSSLGPAVCAHIPRHRAFALQLVFQISESSSHPPTGQWQRGERDRSQRVHDDSRCLGEQPGGGRGRLREETDGVRGEEADPSPCWAQGVRGLSRMRYAGHSPTDSWFGVMLGEGARLVLATEGRVEPLLPSPPQKPYSWPSQHS
jgi:hypothetical protein